VPPLPNELPRRELLFPNPPIPPPPPPMPPTFPPIKEGNASTLAIPAATEGDMEDAFAEIAAAIAAWRSASPTREEFGDPDDDLDVRDGDGDEDFLEGDRADVTAAGGDGYGFVSFTEGTRCLLAAAADEDDPVGLSTSGFDRGGVRREDDEGCLCFECLL